MAIELALYLHTKASAVELITECRNALQAYAVRERAPDVSEARVDAQQNEILSDAYNLTGTKGILFRLDTSEDVDSQMHALLGASLRVLERFPGDAALIFNGDLAYFVRRKGTLEINSRDGMWGPDRLALIRGAYERQDLPDL